MNKNIKILHVFDHSIPLHSGYTFRSRAILEQQRRLGWTTEHVTGPKHNLASKEHADEEVINGLHFYRTTPARLLSRLPVINQWAIVSALEKRLLQILPVIKPDIIHAHSPLLNGLAACRAGKHLGIPVVYEIRAFWEDAAVDHGTTTENSLRYKLTRWLETRVIRKADAVTTICEGLKQDIIARGINEDKISVIPNAVDLDKFTVLTDKNPQLVQQYQLNGKFVIGFAGSFYAYEGLPMIIHALDILIKKYPHLRVLLVGGGPEEDKIKVMVKDHQLDDYVIFPGRVPQEDVQDYYSLIDVLVYPRLSMRLTELVTPLKPLEAMAQKKALLASDVGGHKELIEHDRTGLLFKADDIKSLVQQIERFIQGQVDIKQLTNNGREFVENVRNWKNSVSNYIEIYNGLLKDA